jgi:N-acetylneuraminate synthase
LNTRATTRSIEIAGRKIGPDDPPYVIAELSANHNGSLDAALKLIEAAAGAGADAVKIQTYRADTITIKSDKPEFRIEGGLWHGQTLYELYDKAHTPWEWHESLFDKAKDLRITLFSSPFDESAVDLLESLEAPAFKIASFEAVDLPLVERVAKSGKPVIISTGMANEEEIKAAIDTARQAGCEELVVMHCVSAYPASPSDYNLHTLADIGARHQVLTGLSDHTLGNATAIAAIALGACVIEKHFTLDRSSGGPDASFSLQPTELQDLCRDCRTAWEALGEVDYSRKAGEEGNAQFRRSLYVIADVKAGDLITPDNVKSIRPGYGLAPRHYDDLLGRRFVRDIERATPMSWDLCESTDDENS